MNSIIARVKNSALTFPQVHTPGVAGALVRSLTGSSAKSGSSASSFHSDATYRSPALSVGQAGQRYTLQYPGNGRVDGIVAAQAAAARPAPAQKLERDVVDAEN